MAFTIRLSTLLALLLGLFGGAVGGYQYSKWEPLIAEYRNKNPLSTDLVKKTNSPVDMTTYEMLQEELNRQMEKYSIKANQPLNDIDRYAALIKNQFDRTLKTTDKEKGKECRINIKIKRDGTIQQVQTISGDKALCNAGIQAAEQIHKFPAPPNEEDYEMLKDFNILLNPTH